MGGVGGVLARRWVEEIMAGRLDVVEDVVAQDFVEHAVATFGTSAPGRVDGVAHTKQVVATLRGQFPDLRMVIETIIEEDDMVAVRVMASGTNSGLGMMPPTAAGSTLRRALVQDPERSLGRALGSARRPEHRHSDRLGEPTGKARIAAEAARSPSHRAATSSSSAVSRSVAVRGTVRRTGRGA